MSLPPASIPPSGPVPSPHAPPIGPRPGPAAEDLRPGRPPPPRRPEPGALEAPLKLVHVETHLLLADKPAGLLCVPGRGPAGADCLAARVQAQVPDALITHRLDLATSGLVLMARGAAMLRLLNLGFEQRRMHKRYVAVVAGLMAEDSGSIDAPMTVDWMRRPLQKICPVDGRPALTRWRVLARDPQSNTTRVELEPVTGRSHQLRLHLAVIGHPILGDELYAPPDLCAAAPRLLLHAAELGFTRPALDDQPEAELHFSSPVPF